MKGGMVNTGNFENFKRDVLNHNDNLKRQERQMNSWWNNLEQMLEVEAEYQIFDYADPNTYTFDLVNVLGIIIVKGYLRLKDALETLEHTQSQPDYIVKEAQLDFIHKLNERTINLPVELNREFVEFVQILINHIMNGKF